MEYKHEQTAREFCAAIQIIASKPENITNLEIYLSYHFPEWMKKHAHDPETLTAELKAFSEMEI